MALIIIEQNVILEALCMMHSGSAMPVKDCGFFTYRVTTKFGAGYYAPNTIQTLINYTACCRYVAYIVNCVVAVSHFIKSK